MADPPDVRAFFERHAEASLGAEPAALAAMYGPSFLVAGPKGSAAFANDARFLEWLAGVRAFHDAHGMRALEVLDVGSVPLSPIHRLATVRWGAKFDPGERSIDVRISYLRELAPRGPQILA